MSGKDLPAHLVGVTLAGQYQLEATIGQGGMGLVLAARQMSTGARVAVKLLHAGLLSNAELVRRFQREARTVSQFSGENMARVFDAGITPDGLPFMVMEHLIGVDLSQLLKARGSLPIPEATHFVRQACLGLREAHQRGMVHRDLKPGNLFLTRRLDGSALIKILDFGVSKLSEPLRGENTLTSADSIIGSPQYMAPEQVMASHTVDARADVWSLGVVLVRLLTGQLVFPADSTAQILAAVLTQPPLRLRALMPEAPAELDDIVARCLERDVTLRIGSVDELAELLSPFAAPIVQVGGLIPDLPSGPAPISPSLALAIENLTPNPALRLHRPPPSRLQFYVIMGALGALSLGLAATMAWMLTRDPPERQVVAQERIVDPEKPSGADVAPVASPSTDLPKASGSAESSAHPSALTEPSSARSAAASSVPSIPSAKLPSARPFPTSDGTDAWDSRQ